MIPRVGSSGSDIPVETQMLLMEASKGQDLEDSDETSYIVFLPVIDGEFRSSLQGNSSNELEFCVESGNDFNFHIQRLCYLNLFSVFLFILLVFSNMIKLLESLVGFWFILFCQSSSQVHLPLYKKDHATVKYALSKSIR